MKFFGLKFFITCLLKKMLVVVTFLLQKMSLGNGADYVTCKSVFLFFGMLIWFCESISRVKILGDARVAEGGALNKSILKRVCSKLRIKQTYRN